MLTGHTEGDEKGLIACGYQWRVCWRHQMISSVTEDTAQREQQVAPVGEIAPPFGQLRQRHLMAAASRGTSQAREQAEEREDLVLPSQHTRAAHCAVTVKRQHQHGSGIETRPPQSPRAAAGGSEWDVGMMQVGGRRAGRRQLHLHHANDPARQCGRAKRLRASNRRSLPCQASSGARNSARLP